MKNEKADIGCLTLLMSQQIRNTQSNIENFIEW